MFTYRQILKRLKEGDNKELFSKLSDEDYEILFNHKTLGVFSQIKQAMKEVNTLAIEIPKVGRLEVNPSQLKIKLKKLKSIRNQKVKSLDVPYTLKADLEKLHTSIKELDEDIFKFTKLLIDKYNLYELEDAHSKSKEIKMKLKEDIYIDPIVRERVARLLSSPDLTTEKFIFEMKQINTPVIKSWFLVAYQITNELINIRAGSKSKINPENYLKKAKITKQEFKKILEDGGLYVEC